MASEINNVSALAITRAGLSTLRVIRPSAFSARFPGIDDTSVTDGITPGRFTIIKITLDRPTASQAVAIGVSAGNAIIAALKDLRTAVTLAGHGSLVSSNTNLFDANGSRVSVINIQAQTKILLQKIDALIEKTEFKGANLLSSDGAVIRLQTTQFNGGVNIEAQPLDRAGLGLENINLLEPGGINQTLAKLEKAIILAEQRVGRLRALQQGLDGISSGRQFLTEALLGFGSSTLSRGSLVNLIA